jgi:hypothetical protein
MHPEELMKPDLLSEIRAVNFRYSGRFISGVVRTCGARTTVTPQQCRCGCRCRSLRRRIDCTGRVLSWNSCNGAVCGRLCNRHRESISTNSRTPTLGIAISGFDYLSEAAKRRSR